MDHSRYFEHYTASMKQLSIILQKNFDLLAELDHQSQRILGRIDQLSDELLPNIRSMDSDTLDEKVAVIQCLYDEANGYSDDKVQLTIQSYELVDMFIRRLDLALTHFQLKLQANIQARQARAAQQAASNKKTNTTTVKKGKKNNNVNDKSEATTSTETAGPSSMHADCGLGSSATKNKVVRKGATASTSAVKNNFVDVVSESDSDTSIDVVDMPVDPNEPLFCNCRRVAFGEMISCDNTDCPIEWFHFACVGLENKPKSNWYCPRCINIKK